MDKFLTQDETLLLAEGTEVIITWAGGNGPHKYVIEHCAGITYAQPPENPHGPLRYYNPILLCGNEPWHTKVMEVTDNGTDASSRGSN